MSSVSIIQVFVPVEQIDLDEYAELIVSFWENKENNLHLEMAQA
tara:strand:- start:242 stop:373 length:132 start_codon:yes stop_codon:yes gene_type:complete